MICTWGGLCATTLHMRSYEERADLPGILTNLWVQVESPLLLLLQGTGPESSRHRKPGISLAVNPSSFHLHPELTMYINSPYPNSSQKELVSQDNIGLQERQAKSDTARIVNTIDNQMMRVKGKNISNRNKGYLASSEPSSPTTANPSYLQDNEKARLWFKITSDDDKEL